MGHNLLNRSVARDIGGPITFHNQTAIVTGAGSGIGRAIAILLAKRGARVLVNNRTREKADAVAREITSSGGEAVADGTAIGTHGAARQIIGKAIETFGRIDILINNAAVTSASIPIADTPDDVVGKEIFAINLRGPYELIREVWPTLVQQGYGRILNVCSGAVLGKAGSSAYAASKGGLVGLTSCTALEGREFGIMVNAIWPRAFTRLTSNKDPDYRAWLENRFPPSRIAPVAAFLVSRDVAVTGMNIHVGGGKVGRPLAFVGCTGYFDPSLTPESVRTILIVSSIRRTPSCSILGLNPVSPTSLTTTTTTHLRGGPTPPIRFATDCPVST